MSSVNDINPSVDLTVRIFDNFYQSTIDVPVNEYDVVYSFFQSVFKDPASAKNLAAVFFRISIATGIPIETLMTQVTGQTAIQVTNTLAYYLNGLRSPSTLLGYNAVATPNSYVARNVAI